MSRKPTGPCTGVSVHICTRTHTCAHMLVLPCGRRVAGRRLLRGGGAILRGCYSLDYPVISLSPRLPLSRHPMMVDMCHHTQSDYQAYNPPQADWVGERAADDLPRQE